MLAALAALSLAVGAPAAADPPVLARPVAQVAQGRLVGVADDGIRAFKAIPYALPPVGARRWRPPAPPLAWRGTRDAADFGPSCVQPPVPPASIYFDPPAAMSEDCLTLNVWTPADARGAPVIVWIHGGSLRIGGSAEPLYDGAGFARRGIVFVSVNYRLGVLGWLAHPGLSAESPDRVSGNYGLLDQIAALRWVRDNIAAFGGDPANVTVMGESAGALSVTYLLASPLADGLFARAIMQSTNIRAFPELSRGAYGLPSAEEIGRRLATRLGARDLAALRAMDARDLTRAATEAGFLPQGTIDGRALPAQIADLLDAGRLARVPVIAGFNMGEIRTLRSLMPRPLPDAAAYEAAIRRRHGANAGAFLARYPSSNVEESLLAALRDAVFGWSGERIARTQAARGIPAWFYLFDHCYPAARARDLCAFHAAELPYLFGHVGRAGALPPNWPAPEGPREAALAQVMMDYWVAFARDGDPNGPGRPLWRPYGADQAFMRFADRPTPGADPLPGMFELHEAHVRAQRAAGRQWFLNVVAEPTPATVPRHR